MPLRVSALIRVIAALLRYIANALTVLAEVLEQLGLSQDLDTLIWVFLVVCLVKRRFGLLFSVLGIVIVSSPVWNRRSSSEDSEEDLSSRISPSSSLRCQFWSVA